VVSGWGLGENEVPSSFCQGRRSLIECKPFLKCCLSPYRAYKTIEDDDLKFPLIYGEGKKVGARTFLDLEDKAVFPCCSA
jgi:hypothetical protein